MRLLVVGFDAVGYQSVFKEPTQAFLELMRGHPRGPLQSTKLAHTVPACMAVYEGVDQSDIYGLGKELKTFSWHGARHPLVFDLLADAGIKMGLMGLPLSHPVKNYECFVAPYHATILPRKLPHYPKGIKDNMRNYQGDILNELGVDSYVKLVKNPRKALELSEKFARSYTKNFKKLCALWPIDFGFLYFSFPDRIAHLIPEDSPLVKSIVELCGVLLSDLMDSLKPECLLTFSDHGWGFRGTAQDDTGLHWPNGFYIYTDHGGSHKAANIVDIAPTILRKFNIEIPNYMVGVSL